MTEPTHLRLANGWTVSVLAFVSTLGVTHAITGGLAVREGDYSHILDDFLFMAFGAIAIGVLWSAWVDRREAAALEPPR